MNAVPFTITRDACTIFLGGRPHTIHASQPTYDDLLEALKAGENDEDVLLDLVSPRRAIEKAVEDVDGVYVGTEQIYYRGKPIHNHLTERMLQLRNEGFDIEPWKEFMENLYENPSKQAIDELPLWLEQSGLPITEDGCFLAYKKVRHDYLSFADRKTSNKIGERLDMPRNEVDDRRENTCSTGYHFCSWQYLPHYYGGQGRVMLLKVNPRDVVSIPKDYGNAKGRACGYWIIDEIPESDAPHAFPRAVWSQSEPEEDDDQD